MSLNIQNAAPKTKNPHQKRHPFLFFEKFVRWINVHKSHVQKRSFLFRHTVQREHNTIARKLGMKVSALLLGLLLVRAFRSPESSFGFVGNWRWTGLASGFAHRTDHQKDSGENYNRFLRKFLVIILKIYGKIMTQNLHLGNFNIFFTK